MIPLGAKKHDGEQNSLPPTCLVHCVIERHVYEENTLTANTKGVARYKLSTTRVQPVSELSATLNYSTPF